MDYFRRRKILVFLLGYLSACSGKQMRLSSGGYNYNEDLSNLNRILKAVLVHESTGNGLFPESVSNPGFNGGEIIKVSKQAGYSGGHTASSGYSYSASQQMKANVVTSQSAPIRVFHESPGNKGHIQPQPSTMPQVSLVKIVRDYRPTNEQRSTSGFAFNPNPARTLQYIHEAALSRSRSDHQFSSDSNIRAQSQFAPLQGGNGGYQNEKPEQTRNVGDHQSGGSIDGSRNRGISGIGPGPNGYKYPAPNQPFRQGFSVQAFQAVNSSPVQSLNQGLSVENSKSGAVQDVNSGQVQTLNQGYGVESLQASNSGSVQNFNQGFDVQNFGSGPAQAIHSSPLQTFNQKIVESGSVQAVNTSPNYALNEGPINSNFRKTSSESVHTAPNSYQYPALLKMLSTGFVNENQRNSESNPVQVTHLNSIQNENLRNANSVQVNNENLRNTQIGSLQPVRVGYQYSSPGQTKSGGYSNENPRNLLSNEGLQSGNSAGVSKDESYRYENSRNAGYSYKNPEVPQGNAEQISISQYVSSIQRNSANQGYRYENAARTQNTDPQNGYQYADQSTSGGHHNESPGGYQYSNQEARQGAQNTISGQNINPAFNRLEKPRESTFIGYGYVAPTQNVDESYSSKQTADIGLQNKGLDNRPESAKSVFKGQPYLPLPPTPQNTDSKYESPRPAQSESFRFDNPDLSQRPETTFQGHSYLPLPPTASGSQFEAPRIPQSDGYRYDKPDLSKRPETTFKGQPYLPLPPVSGGR